jgi:hypothetical protein
MQNYQQRTFIQSQPITATNAPNSSIATMGPETFQNSPFNQGGYNMGNPSPQLNQQLQEQNYLQNVRQQFNNQFGQQPQINQQPVNTMFNQKPMQQMSMTQPFMNQNNSLASMDPSTYQNFQAFQQQHRSNFTAQPQQSFQQNSPNASVATMGPETFQNSPFNQGGYNMGSPSPQLNQQQQEQNYLQNVRQQLNSQFGQQPQYNQTMMNSLNYQRPMQQMSMTQPFMNQNNSLASMDPSTYQNFEAFQQQHRGNFTTQPQQNFQQNSPNASVATMGPETFQNSPFNQGGYNMGNPSPMLNQQQQEQNYLQNVRQQLNNQNQQLFNRMQ